MTLTADKIELFKELLGEDVDGVSDAAIEFYLEDAGSMILSRIYSMVGVPDDAEVPAEYGTTQIKLAVTLFNLRGVEGETSHTEVGVRRDYGDVNRLLRNVMPRCTGVRSSIAGSGDSTYFTVQGGAK